MRLSNVLAAIFITYIVFISGGQGQPCGLPVWVGSWNTKHLGRAGFDFKRAAMLIRDFDVVALQEVNKGKTGSAALSRLKAVLAKDTDQKWCSALSLVPTGSRERYGYLWKNSRLSWVKNKSGQAILDCSDNHLTAPLVSFHQLEIVREPSVAIFKSKQSPYKFKLVNVHLVPTKKSPEKEVPFLFDALSPAGVPVIVAGDFNLSADSSAFNAVRQKGWVNVLAGGVKTSLKMKMKRLNKAYDNFWVFDRNFNKRACDRSVGVKNNYQIFKNLPLKHVYNQISDHVPIYMQVFETPQRGAVLKPSTTTLKPAPVPLIQIENKPAVINQKAAPHKQ